MFHLSPSLLCADQMNMASQVEQLEKLDFDWYHIDVMDGAFVPNFAFGTDFVQSLTDFVSKPIYVHLMAENPANHVEAFAKVGADYFCFHIETTNNPFRVASEISRHNMKAAVALNPFTPVASLESLLDYVDVVTLMSIEPGFSGQKFMDFTYEKIMRLKELIEKRNAKVLIEVDGGINGAIAKKCIDCGCDVLVGGYFSLFDKNGSLVENYQRYLKDIGEASISL